MLSDTKTYTPQLAVTLGDPAGIGTEVILKALAAPLAGCVITLVGSRSRLVATYQQLRSRHPTLPLANPDDLQILDITLAPDLEQQIAIGQESAASGAASFQYLETAIAHALSGAFHGIVTGPISKAAWSAAGHPYPGQTELLAERAGVDRFGMLFVARSPHTGWILRTLLATTHIPLRDVADALTPALLTRKLDLLLDCLRQDFGLEAPRIAIAGLNPHSGEQGKLGHEEQDWLIPWLEDTRLRLPHLRLDGPTPPDTLWVKPGQAWFGSTQTAAAFNPADAYLALYHDQGLIPVKLMAFDRAVNTSIGLPFVRTSPDHGTAFDIAGLGIAEATSMRAALELAVALCHERYKTGNTETSDQLSSGSANVAVTGI
ncbi:4-hydroxythreonine-4-phosphate dehydrogenase PdxA [Leptolyngbya sp. FACHB-321]|uniref:4-hydroxythreonine-4-phosphate dehydrogenase PdxA n=1 Tax=Leptolyngbya sp. FACHB-321 TaxID=2692807 RepID=UPI001682DE08|nr:4-hydroxythreonine-4-phosphate dehydrogenase PdxA [Leptolyngbya sp. FACHB-321]MBD2038656.1 4-hydroxythreonine-4-phosphate dehydrogenase PdxA [Leptolyngbya sp. FACHB-321]